MHRHGSEEGQLVLILKFSRFRVSTHAMMLGRENYDRQ